MRYLVQRCMAGDGICWWTRTGADESAEAITRCEQESHRGPAGAQYRVVDAQTASVLFEVTNSDAG